VTANWSNLCQRDCPNCVQISVCWRTHYPNPSEVKDATILKTVLVQQPLETHINSIIRATISSVTLGNPYELHTHYLSFVTCKPCCSLTIHMHASTLQQLLSSQDWRLCSKSYCVPDFKLILSTKHRATNPRQSEVN
jgi:hypothetical protein